MADIRGSAIIMGILLGLGIFSASSIADFYSRSVFYFKSNCGDITNEPDCGTAGCYWWDDSCHAYRATAGNAEVCVEVGHNIVVCVKSNGETSIMLMKGRFYE